MFSLPASFTYPEYSVANRLFRPSRSRGNVQKIRQSEKTNFHKKVTMLNHALLEKFVNLFLRSATLPYQLASLHIGDETTIGRWSGNANSTPNHVQLNDWPLTSFLHTAVGTVLQAVPAIEAECEISWQYACNAGPRLQENKMAAMFVFLVASDSRLKESIQNQATRVSNVRNFGQCYTLTLRSSWRCHSTVRIFRQVQKTGHPKNRSVTV